MIRKVETGWPAISRPPGESWLTLSLRIVLGFEEVVGRLITGGEEEWDKTAGLGSSVFVFFFVGSFRFCALLAGRSSADSSSMKLSGSTEDEDPASSAWRITFVLGARPLTDRFVE